MIEVLSTIAQTVLQTLLTGLILVLSTLGIVLIALVIWAVRRSYRQQYEEGEKQ